MGYVLRRCAYKEGRKAGLGRGRSTALQRQLKLHQVLLELWGLVALQSHAELKPGYLTFVPLHQVLL